MSALLLAPVWSIEWKIALIVLLGIAVLICALLIAYAVVMYRRRENRTPEDEFQIADDGGFGKIVNVNDYKIPSQTQQPPVANPQDSNQQAPVPYSGNVLMPPATPVPYDISQRVGYVPQPYTLAPQSQQPAPKSDDENQG